MWGGDEWVMRREGDQEPCVRHVVGVAEGDEKRGAGWGLARGGVLTKCAYLQMTNCPTTSIHDSNDNSKTHNESTRTDQNFSATCEA